MFTLTRSTGHAWRRRANRDRQAPQGRTVARAYAGYQKVVPAAGIEPATSSLQNWRSTN